MHTTQTKDTVAVVFDLPVELGHDITDDVIH